MADSVEKDIGEKPQPDTDKEEADAATKGEIPSEKKSPNAPEPEPQSEPAPELKPKSHQGETSSKTAVEEPKVGQGGKDGEGGKAESLGGSRVRQATPKMIAYEQDQADTKFKYALSAWRRKASKVEKVICDSADASALRNARDDLERDTNIVIDAFHNLRHVLSDVPKEQEKKFEEFDEANLKMLQRLTDAIQSLE